MTDLTGPTAERPLNWLLVSGGPRSGASILRALIAEHPAVAILQEYGLKTFVDRVDALLSGGEQRSCVEDLPLDRQEPVDRAALFHRPAGSPTPDKFDAVVRGIIAALEPEKRAAWIGDTSPLRGDWEDVPALLTRLGRLRMIFVIRNPRGAINSSLLRRDAARRGYDAWPVETVQDAVREWSQAMRRIFDYREVYGRAVHVLKYEDLCQRREEVMARLFAFLDLPVIEHKVEVRELPANIDALSPEEAEYVDRMLGDIGRRWSDSSTEDLLDAFAQTAPPYQPGERILLSRPEADPYLGEGFYWREEWGRWTAGERATIRLAHGLGSTDLLVELWVARAFTRPSEPCDVVIKAGDALPTLFSLGEGSDRLAVMVPPGREDGVLTIELNILRPKKETEPPADSRHLGLGLEAFRVSSIQLGRSEKLGPTRA